MLSKIIKLSVKRNQTKCSLTKVIRTFNKYFKENVSNDDSYESMKKFEKFVLLLRMDIGQSNKALKKWDLIKMFIVAEDIDKKGEIIFDKK